MLQFWACRDIRRNSADGAGVCWSVAQGWTEQRNVWKIHSAGTDTIPCICLRGCYGWNIWSCILAGFALLEGKESWLGMVIDWMKRLLSRWDLQLGSQIHTICLDLTFDMLNAWQFPLPLVICAGYLLLLIAKLLGKCSDPHPCTLISSPSLGRAWKVFQILVCVQNVLILCPTVCVPHWLSSLYPIVFWIQPPVPDGIPKLKYLFPVFDCSWNIGRKLKGKTANWWCDMMRPLVNLLWLSIEIGDQ